MYLRKKMLILTLTLVVLFVVSGCGGTSLKNPAPNVSPPQDVGQPSVSETQAAESDAHASQAESTQAPASDARVEQSENTQDVASNLNQPGSTPVGERGTVIVSDNPVLTDSKTLLEELDQEIDELLKSLESMDSVDDEDLIF